MKNLFVSAMLKFTLGVVLIGALVFIPAGTLKFFNGWLFMGILFIPMFIAGIIMLVRSPSLLKSRLDAKEKEKEQSIVIKLSGLMFICGFVLAGLDYRFNLLQLPRTAVFIGAALFLAAYVMYAEVLRENAFLSRTIKVQENQTVVDSGLYGIIRHPMYSATVILFLSIPIVLGSLISLPVFLVYPFIIAFRIKHEEKFLERELPGYVEYKKKVKKRLIPFIW